MPAVASSQSSPDDGGRRDRLVAVAALAARLVSVAAAAVIAVILVGVPLALAGFFRPIWLTAGALPAMLLIDRALSPVLARPVANRRAALALLAAFGWVALTGLVNLVEAAQHHATERDPGVYLETGLWLAEHGDLVVEGRAGPFLGEDFGGSAGFTEVPVGSGRLEAQFPHGTATLIGVGGWLGPAFATRVVPAVAVVMAALWALLFSRILSPWWATAALVAASANVTVFHFVRDTYSEPVVALLLAVCLLCLDDDRPISWFAAGLALGAAGVVRVDALLVAVALAGSLVLVATRGERRAHVGAVVVGALPGGVIAAVDLTQRSSAYLADKWGVVRPALWSIAALVLLAGLVAAVTARVSAGRWLASSVGAVVGEPGDKRRRMAATFLVAVVVATAAWGLLVRPEVVTLRGGVNGHIGGLQARDGLTVDPTRTYAEQSVVWLTWYYGLPAFLLAVVGVCVAVWRGVVEARWCRPVALVSVLMGLPSLVYLVDPHISGDQIWAMRRFLPVTVPALVIAAAAGAGVVADLAARMTSRWDRHLLPLQPVWRVVLAAAVLAPGLSVSLPLWNDRTLLWPTFALEDLCDSIPPDAAVLVDEARLLGAHLTQPLARECGVPAASGDASAVDLVGLDESWRAEGRRLILVFDALAPVPDVVADARVPLPVRQLESAVERRPTAIEAGDRVVVVARPLGEFGF